MRLSFFFLITLPLLNKSQAAREKTLKAAIANIKLFFIDKHSLFNKE